MPQKINRSDTTPAAPAGTVNVKWQADAPSSDPSVLRNVSAYMPLFGASGGSHAPGAVPDPGAVAGTSRFLREDLSWAVPAGGGGGGAGAVAFSQAASPATLNLSTQGTKDWFILNASTANPPRAQASGNLHSKAIGGWIRQTFEWFSGGGGGGPTVAGSSGISMTTLATDDTANPVLSASTPNATYMGGTSPTPINFGYVFRVPADTTVRTLRLNMAVNGVKAQITCRMVDASIADQTTTVDALVDNGYVQKELTITYNAGSNGSEMIVEVRVITNYSTSTHTAAVYFISATLA